MRQSLGQFLGPISNHISSARSAAQIISRNPRHGLKLLLNSRSEPRIQSQPDVYPFAAYLGERFECTHVIVVGRPTAKDLIQLYPQFEIIGIVPAADLQLYRNQYGFGTWLEENSNLAGTLSVPEDVLKHAVIVCNDLEQFVSPDSLLKNLKTCLEYALVCILTSSDRDLDRAVLENWSTDSTYDLAKELESRLPVTVERFPKEGPSEYFDWGAMLERMEALSGEIKADWFVRRGADEVLTSPWPGVSYRDGLYLVDQSGFNCVDHTIVEFHPVDDGFKTGMDHEGYFRHFDFKHLSHSRQRRAWKNFGQPISTIPSAGHDVLFDGRRIYPFKFLSKHYSFRSQRHGEKKVFRERKAGWNPKERARGWHIHYDSIQEGHRFVQSASQKEVFDEDHFNKTYVVERHSGIGTHRKSFY